ncbi:MAG: nuclear transport factor 2 family protein [Acidimicrobiia bacterium]|nr:nuclear transport factor 2 family protein [Acidimicrobiia bacterium]
MTTAYLPTEAPSFTTPSLQSLATSSGLEEGLSLDDSSVLHVSGSSGLAGDYQGPDAIEAWFQRMDELTFGSLRIEGEHVVVASEGAVVVGAHLDATRTGRRLHTGVLLILSIEDSALREAWMFHSDQSRVDEFWTVL